MDRFLDRCPAKRRQYPLAFGFGSPNDIKLASMAREGPDAIYPRLGRVDVPIAFPQFSPDGRWLHTVSPHWKMTACRVWNADIGEPYRVLGHKHLVTTATFDSTSKLFAITSDEGAIFLWRMKTMEWMEAVLSEPQDPCGRHATIAFSQDGMQVFRSWAVLSTVLVQVWDPFAGDRFMSLKGRKSSVLSLCFLP